ncbi:hypothetical protein [Luteibacter sp. CQ10]|uniref:hypothetical protein n=1 Tax=Luteibacter sp. CQ10 TaxID=2805821 RepID=UPI0034A3E5BA
MYLALMLGCALGACPSPQPPGHSTARAVLDGPDGPGTVVNLMNRYNDLSIDCRGEPAVRCTGVLLESSDDRDPWQPFADDGVPMSWFRRDAPITGMYPPQAGMFYYPADRSVQFGKRPINVQCAYVLNAFTDFRPSRCGGFDEPGNPESGPCQPQGITTAAAWFAHMDRNPQKPNQAGSWQCGFDLTAPDRAVVFSHFPELMREYLVKHEPRNGYNELVAFSWPHDQPDIAPIEAFFYRAGPFSNPVSALERARALQVRMNDVGGIWRPIIEVRFPTDPGQPVLFGYNEADQARPVPVTRH